MTVCLGSIAKVIFQSRDSVILQFQPRGRIAFSLYLEEREKSTLAVELTTFALQEPRGKPVAKGSGTEVVLELSLRHTAV